MTDRKTDERAWRVGATGEVRVGTLLAKLSSKGFRVLHSVPVGQEESDIDHVVIGPPGVFTVNTKKHPDAKIWVGGNCVKVNGSNYPYVRNSRFEARRAEKLLALELGWHPPVTPLLVFDTTGAGGLNIKTQPEDVVVMEHRGVQSWLSRQPAVLDSRQVAAVFEVARRSTTWTRPLPRRPRPAA